MAKIPTVLGFDIGATKLAWGLVQEDGELLKQGEFPTPHSKEDLLEKVATVVEQAGKVKALGVGIAGVTTANHEDIVVFPNIPELSHFQIVKELRSSFGLPVALDNDARCALVGESWLGSAIETSSAVLITVGTGIGGAVKQKGSVLPHPTDVSKEIGRIVADPTDLLPVQGERGTIEALIGGKNLEMRFGISMKDVAIGAKAKNPEDVQLFEVISNYFMQCLRAIVDVYNPKMIIVGGHGSEELDLYLQGEPPRPVIPAALGKMAGVFGAARLALDLHEKQLEEDKEWGDEEEEEE